MAARHGDWLRQAGADLRHARRAREDGAHEWACFAAQQAAEKALKAVLLQRGAEAWGHTVTALLGAVAPEDVIGVELMDCARTLDKHYIPTRYPNGFDSGAPVDFYMRKDSDDAIACAGKILDVARHHTEQPDGGPGGGPPVGAPDS